jgi:hypothetical protein
VNQKTVALVLSIGGVLIGVGGFLSQPQNLAILSPTVAHYVAAVGALLYVVGQALEHTLTRQQVATNATVLQQVVQTNGLKAPPANGGKP